MAESTLFQIKKSVYDYVMSFRNDYLKTSSSRSKDTYTLLAEEYNTLNSIHSVSDLNTYIKKVETMISNINNKINRLKESYKAISASNPTDYNLRRISNEIRDLHTKLEIYQTLLNKIKSKEQDKKSDFPPLDQTNTQTQTKNSKFTETKPLAATPVQTKPVVETNTPNVVINQNGQRMVKTASGKYIREDVKKLYDTSIEIINKYKKLYSNTLSSDEKKKLRIEIYNLTETRRQNLSSLLPDEEASRIEMLESYEKQFASEAVLTSKETVSLDKTSFISQIKGYLSDLGDLKIKGTNSSRYKSDESKSQSENQTEVDKQVKRNMYNFTNMINSLFGKREITILEEDNNVKYTTKDLLSYISTYGFARDFQEYSKNNAGMKVGNSELNRERYNQNMDLIGRMIEKLGIMSSSRIDAIGGKITIKPSNEKLLETKSKISSTITEIYKQIDLKKVQDEQISR
jgi:hypothetical protein